MSFKNTETETETEKVIRQEIIQQLRPGIVYQMMLRSCQRLYSSSSTIQLIKKLREEIHAPLNLVKSAVAQAEPKNDYDSALAILRTEMTKRGEKLVAKSSDRATNEGVVVTARSEDGQSGAIVVLNCETDFVAKSNDFRDLATDIAKTVMTESGPIGTHAPITTDNIEMQGKVIPQILVDRTSLFGERINLTSSLTTRLAKTRAFHAIGIHCHGGTSISKDVWIGRMGTLINVSADRDLSNVDELAREVVAQNPETIEEFWTLEKIGDKQNRTIRQWIGDDVEIDAWTRLEKS